MPGIRDSQIILRVLSLALLAAPLSVAGQGNGQGNGQAELFVDASASSGFDFHHFNGMSGELYLAEVMGSGGGFLDYDGDGDLDIYVSQGSMLGPGKTIDDASFVPQHPSPQKDRLYRNDTRTRNGKTEIRFTDVTDQSGIAATGYGMGVATGDINNDGFVDLYVTNFRNNQMWLNKGDGTFEDITASAGVDDDRWSVSAAFLDFDRDGWLDLYVGNYVRYDINDAKICRSGTTARDYCGPLAFEPEPDRLFRNKGDGSFEDVSQSSGILKVYGGALGVVATDFNGDHLIDIFVANDSVANQLWINAGDGTFVDEAPLAGVSVNRNGMPEASMGVDAADFDGDGDEDLFMTHLVRETNTLYVNDGSGWFDDQTLEYGLGATSMAFTSFGTAWFDYDNDSWLDILVVNGGVTLFESQGSDKLFPLDRANQLFANRGNGKYEDVTEKAGAAFELSEVSRGAAFGDIDNDGDIDVLITNNNGPARLLLNQVGQNNAWLGVRVIDGDGERDALGAKVSLSQDKQSTLWRRVRSEGSYASANDPRVVFGLGTADGAQTVTVLWPDGKTEIWENLSPNQYHTLTRGSGKPAS